MSISSAEAAQEVASVRYLVNDVDEAVNFYTTHLGFTLRTDTRPKYAAVARGPLQLLLSGPASSGAHATPDTYKEGVGPNRIRLTVEDLDTEIKRLQGVGVSFQGDVTTSPGGRQILLADPAGNLLELFQPEARQPA
ncbi:VOC family protein [Streptomyces noursei]|uniref:VOC family protein n=1 Tax=Streptomyces noursei TaxID=1971 RepID=UPI00167849F7|nr:VOC family protein [Streptomyces noursei]MCZ1021191.1 VOC family protein [Streptomyces noursei]GGX58846.1 glyoxalase [Streptomyces noursei]